jgi:nicotinamide phosphoribosyltransferase
MTGKENIILLADAYKYSHHKLYYPGTSHIYSYFESRGGKFESTVFFGLQYFLKNYLEGIVITNEKIAEAQAVLPNVFGREDVFDSSKFGYILEKHGGKLPVRIRAVKEGAVVPVNNVLMTIENTDPACFWLTNFLETLLVQTWYPCTVATLSHQVRKIVTQYYDQTAAENSRGNIDFVLNDFGYRGVSSVESAGIGDMAHLLSFSGSDTIIGSVYAQRYYDAQKIYGLSIPATEHSICTLLGEEGEEKIFRHVLETFPEGTVACVSDSYDILRACRDYWGTSLKEIILQRNGTLVIRPDSGDPVFTLLKVFSILFEKFGYTINDKGFRVLPSQIRVIQGDGVDYDAIRHIYNVLKVNGISAENLSLGMGGGLLQKLNRDTQNFAFKCSYAEVNNKPIDVSKTPLEFDRHGEYHTSFKKSKAGKLKLVLDENGYRTVKADEEPAIEDQLEAVFENGQIMHSYFFEEVKSNLPRI